MHLHKLSDEGAALFTKMKVGDSLPLKSFLPGLSKKTVLAKLMETTKGKYWEFKLTWFDVFVGTAYVEKLPSGQYEFGEL